ncbi:MAG TPA: hypothetical protein VJT75_01870 [Thermoleophilaceae bacterium]|nr:hypothetical protein [Thermoleophilaceae bacterium]
MDGGTTSTLRGTLLLVLALVACAALATDGRASSISLRFAAQTPGKHSTMRLVLRYTKPGSPGGKPSPIRHLVIDAPAGTVFHRATFPACRASDSEVMAAGPGACPAASRIGGGPITVLTGFGKPFDPFVSPTAVFNDGRGWLEISETPSEPRRTIAVTRLKVAGRRISGDIAATPGGPPDGQSAVSTVDLSFGARRYFTTPRTCTSTRRWVTKARYTFADGRTEAVRGTTRCRPIAKSAGPSIP